MIDLLLFAVLLTPFAAGTLAVIYGARLTRRLDAIAEELTVVRTGLGIAKVVDERSLDVTVAAKRSPHEEHDGGETPIPFKAYGLQTMRTRQRVMEAALRNAGAGS